MDKCVYAEDRAHVRKWKTKVLVGVREDHGKPPHRDPAFVGPVGGRVWVQHMAYKAIIRMECRKRGL